MAEPIPHQSGGLNVNNKSVTQDSMTWVSSHAFHPEKFCLLLLNLTCPMRQKCAQPPPARGNCDGDDWVWQSLRCLYTKWAYHQNLAAKNAPEDTLFKGVQNQSTVTETICYEMQ